MSTADRLVDREGYTRPTPSAAEQLREGGVELDRADPRDVCRRGPSRPDRGAKYRRLYGYDDY